MLVFLQQQKNATVVVYSLLEKSLKKFELAGCPSQYARITPFSAQKKKSDGSRRSVESSVNF
jgi:hypothetical protein